MTERATTRPSSELPLSEREMQNILAMVEKGQQLAGHFPSDEDMAAARRILTGESTYEAEMADFEERHRE
ncbi:hypothetical protein [Barrientosiimonas humi]|uniref:hypothetical protein n=1 Tax=Barrientosiimonas humi TaxID=999931 RepID=UPI00370D2E92